MPDDLNKRIDNKLEDNCCDCDESKNPSSGVCPAPLEHMTNWRTEHTRIRLPEDNFAFQVETQKINPNDCNCDPIVESCCNNLNDIPDVVYADFFVDTTLGNAYPCLRPQEGRLGAFNSYSARYVHGKFEGSVGCHEIKTFVNYGTNPINIFNPALSTQYGFNSHGQASFDFSLKKILERVGGSLAEDKRYVDKFTVELRRDRTFDSHALPQTISAVRHIYDVKETLNGEGYHYREYYYRENCAPTGVVWSRQPPLNLVKDIPPCEYTQLKTIDCVPKMVWSGKAKTPGGREIQVLYFCDGVDSATGANTFKTMIFHLDTIKNEWGTFKERDFWNIFEKFEPLYDFGDWWSWQEDRDWGRFLMYDIELDEHYLDPNQDYRLLQNYNYLSTIGYREWIEKDDPTWTYYKNLSVSCKNYYQEYCSKRGYYVPPQESVQLDAPFQATVLKQFPPFKHLDTGYPYDEGLNLGCYNDPLVDPIILEGHYKRMQGGYSYLPNYPYLDEYDDDYYAAYPLTDPTLAPSPSPNYPGYNGWLGPGFTTKRKITKGPKIYTMESSYPRSLDPYPTSINSYKFNWNISCLFEDIIDNVYDCYYPVNKTTKYPLGVLKPEKANILVKLFGRWNCPWTNPTRFRGFQSAGKISFPFKVRLNNKNISLTTKAECLVYKPYFSPPFYKVEVRYSLKDKPVEEHPSAARLYCPKLPESFLETKVVPSSKPWGYSTEFVKQIADFPNGIYPKHLFVTVEKTLLKASGRNNLRVGKYSSREYLNNVGPPGGTPWFEPKEISSHYSDLFYRISFVGALGTPENLSLIYGTWRDPETFKIERDRGYYNLAANLQYLNTFTFYDDVVAELKVTSTDPEVPAGSITLSSPQEGFSGNAYHRFTNQDLECPYIEFPLMTYKTCWDFDGLYGPDGCVHFPYISPIGEESSSDDSYLYIDTLRLSKDSDATLFVGTHSDDWSASVPYVYRPQGFNNPNLGSYVKGEFLTAFGVLGGATRFGTASYGSSRLNAYDCDELDLTVLWLESEAKGACNKPFPNLSPTNPYVNGSESPKAYLQYFDIRTHYFYTSRDTKNKIRQQVLSFAPSRTCDKLALQSTHLNLYNGITDVNDVNTMLAFNLPVTTVALTPWWGDAWVVNTVESPYYPAYVYNADYSFSIVILKPANQVLATDAYLTAGFYEKNITNNIAAYKNLILGEYESCSLDQEGVQPTVNHKVIYETVGTLYDVPLEYDDYSGLVQNPDGSLTFTPHPYYVNRSIINYGEVTYVNKIQPLSEIIIPNYVYPHGFYFKCIVTA